MSDHLSEELLRCANRLEQEFLEDGTPEERSDWPAHKRLVESIVSTIISTRETVRSEDLAAFEEFASENREMVDGLLDSYYTIRALGGIRSLVVRTMRLTRLKSTYTPSLQTNRYIQEAARAYISGLPMASVAMSRAALEQALKDKFAKQRDGDRDITLRKLVDDYAKKWSIFDAAEAKAAKDLADECNQLLHEKPVESDDKAFEILTAIRSLIERIFTAEGGY